MADRNAIWRRATELGSLLAQTEEVTQYKIAEAELLQHKRASDLMQQLKWIQTQLDANGLPESDVEEKFELQVESILDELETIPQMQHFEEAQKIVNALLQTVSRIIADSVSDQAELRKLNASSTI